MEETQEKRIAVLSVVAEKGANTELLNATLSDFAEYIVGRMGIPYRERGVNVISVVLDIPTPEANALSGKIGKIEGVSAKILFSKK